MSRETKIDMYCRWMEGEHSLVQLSMLYYVSIEYVSDAIIEGSMMYEGETL